MKSALHETEKTVRHLDEMKANEGGGDGPCEKDLLCFVGFLLELKRLRAGLAQWKQAIKLQRSFWSLESGVQNSLY